MPNSRFVNSLTPLTKGDGIRWFPSAVMASIWVFFYFWVAFAGLAGEVIDALGSIGGFAKIRELICIQLPEAFVNNWHFIYLPLFALVDHSIEVYRDVRFGAIEKRSTASRLWVISLAFALIAVLITAAVEDISFKESIMHLLVIPITLLTIGFKGATYRLPRTSKPVVRKFDPKTS